MDQTRGFGFVYFTKSMDAKLAQALLNSTEVDERKIVVDTLDGENNKTSHTPSSWKTLTPSTPSTKPLSTTNKGNEN